MTSSTPGLRCALAAALLALAGCGRPEAVSGAPDAGGTGVTDGGGGGGGGGATLSVLSTVPRNGDTGVASGAVLTITFSAPMDQAATGAAYASTSPGLRPGDVTLSWSADGTVLTVSPNARLAYATGTDPAATAALAYAYSIGAGARDLSGDALPPLAVSFTTLRRISIVEPGDPAQDGSVSGVTVSNGAIDFGFGPTGRGFLGFGLAGLPAALQPDAIVTATLRVNSEYPLVYNTEVVSLEQVVYGPTLIAQAATTAPLRALGNLAAESPPEGGWKRADVTAAVRDDWANRAARGGRTQYRLACTGCTTVIFFAAEAASSTGSAGQLTPRLLVDYLVP